MTTRLIGAAIRRNEDPRLLRGLGWFVDDVSPAACFTRPAYAARTRGRASGRSTPLAPARCRGVHLVLTAAELGELNQPTPLLIPHPS